MIRSIPLAAAPALALALAACSGGTGAAATLAEAPAPDGHLFTRLPAAYTGVRFENRLEETNELNVFTYRNFYNGGGAALGDLTGDGLPELVLTANQRGPSVYLNRGRFRFQDVTEASGIEAERHAWTTGVALADVNGDGRLDVYVCQAGTGEPAERANRLWINQGPDASGVPRFEEEAERYGVADQGWSTQAAFLDYDRDGDLDLYVVNNSPRAVSSLGLSNTRDQRDPWGGDHLYRNDGGHFVDVSAAAGIHGPEVAFGLGVAVGDVNRDGWPDLYVSNDFFERDYLYVNRGDGTFAEALDRQMPVTTYFSMGLDVADVDNDGWPDVYTTDMLPEDDARLKLTGAFEGWEVYQEKVRNGYHHQLMRNMLQRSNRDGTFSDVGQLAGVARTDWSWSALLADFDLDGRKDIFVGNGIAKDITAQDYVAYLGSEQTMRGATSSGKRNVDFLKLLAAATSTPLSNYLFHNEGDLRFTNAAAAWGLDTPSFSSGAAYGDLDGDGAPDLVVNNVNGEAFVYRNNARTQLKANHWLSVALEGEGLNRFAVGARVALAVGADTLVQELAPVRGFQSSVDYVLSFGLGARDTVDALTVQWPDGRTTTLATVAADRKVTVRLADLTKAGTTAGRPAPARPTFVPHVGPLALVEDSTALDFAHHEDDFVDFDREHLVPKLLSIEGPALAVADVNGDGLDDAFLGGAKEQAGRLLLQRPDGRFAPSNPGLFEPDAISEDVGALFFDANGDGRPDLYVVSGGSEYGEGSDALQDRLYLNDGGGRFHKAPGALPVETTSGSRAAAADFDGDGDLDLFVGGRAEPGGYGADPRSFLLRNDGRGRFTDVTEAVAPGLARVGMVTDAAWMDADGDGRADLVVVGEWMPVTVFRNAGGRLARLDVPGLARSEGWWNRVVPTDVDGDGRLDLVLGNLGLDTRLTASDSEPASMVVKDFDRNGFAEQIVSTYQQGKSRPLALRDDLLRSLPGLRARFPDHKRYATATTDDVIPPAERLGAIVKTARTFASAVAHNDGNGRFTLLPLPRAAQVAPIYGILATDVDGDGHTDLLLGGNFDGFEPSIGRAHASFGVTLRGDGKGGWTPMAPVESGFYVPGQTRGLARLRTRGGAYVLAARNDDRALLFRLTPRAATVASRK